MIDLNRLAQYYCDFFFIDALFIVFQGSVSPTVNQGPLEIAKCFLDPSIEESQLITKEHQFQLRQAFVEFTDLCSKGLKRHKEMIGNDQKEYHKMMEKAFKYVDIGTDIGQHQQQ